MPLTRMILKAHGCVAFVAGEPTTGAWFAQIVQRFAQLVYVLGTAAVVTYGIASAARGLVDVQQVKVAIERMIKPEEQGSSSPNPLMEEIEGEIEDPLYLRLQTSAGEGELGYAVLVGVGNELRDLNPDPCAVEVIVPQPNGVCLFRVRRVIGGAMPASIADTLVEFQFPGTAYAIPQLVVEATMLNNPDKKFTRKRAEKVTQAVEELISEYLFLPSSSEVEWGRRLNGPIQLIIYFLGATALVIIALGWVNSVLQNWAVRTVRTVALQSKGGTWHDVKHSASAPECAPVPAEPEPQTLGESPQADPVPNGRSQAEEKVVATEIEDFPVPWSDEFRTHCPLDLADAQRTANYYEDVSQRIQKDSEIFGVRIDPPALRLRLAAVRAVANTKDTSIVPMFLDAQRNAILSFYDARMSVVRFLLWVIPTVGFIGTILGVSAALSSTIGLQSTRDLVTGFAQSSVSASMGIAFDTTLVGLAAAISVMLAYHVAQGAEERMTVLERNRVEEEVMEVSKLVRKPGGPVDLAQQLISLGINTEFLVRDLQLFQKTGPELASIIKALSEHKKKLEKPLDLDAISGRSRRGMWLAAVAVCIGAILSFGGYLGEEVKQAVHEALKWVLSRI